MLSIVILVHNRPRLTRQALESLKVNTSGPYNLTVVNDGSGLETTLLLRDWFTSMQWPDRLFLREQWPSAGPGRARNYGIEASERQFGRLGLLYLCDNDCFFKPGWDQALLKCWNAPERAQARFIALGAYAHPFQQRGALISNPDAMAGHSIAPLEALGLFSWLMEWGTWDKYGPFLPSAEVNGSEDWEYCQRIRRDGGKVGVVEPALVVNCGITSSDGRLCPGAAHLWEQQIPDGVILE